MSVIGRGPHLRAQHIKYARKGRHQPVLDISQLRDRPGFMPSMVMYRQPLSSTTAARSTSSRGRRGGGEEKEKPRKRRRRRG